MLSETVIGATIFTVPEFVTANEYGIDTPTVANEVVVDDLTMLKAGVPIASVAIAELLAALSSFVAPVVPLSVELPAAVGVPETVQSIEAPAATVVGVEGAHDAVKPAGSPLIAHDAAVAATAGALAFEQV